MTAAGNNNMDVNTPASKQSQLIGNTAIVRKRCVIHKKVDMCVLASFSCRVYAEKQGRKVRPVAGLTCFVPRDALLQVTHVDYGPYSQVTPAYRDHYLTNPHVQLSRDNVMYR